MSANGIGASGARRPAGRTRDVHTTVRTRVTHLAGRGGEEDEGGGVLHRGWLKERRRGGGFRLVDRTDGKIMPFRVAITSRDVVGGWRFVLGAAS